MTSRKIKFLCLSCLLFLNILLLSAEEDEEDEKMKIYADKTATTLRNPIVYLQEKDMFLTSFGRNNLFTVDIYTGRVEKIFDDDTKNPICHIFLSADGKYIFCIEDRGGDIRFCTSYIVMDRASFRVVKSFSVEGSFPPSYSRISSSDGKYIGISQSSQELLILSLTDFVEVFRIKLNYGCLISWSISSDERVIINFINYNDVRDRNILCDIKKNVLIKDFEDQSTDLGFSPYGHFIFSSDSLYDAKSLKYIKNMDWDLRLAIKSGQESFIIANNEIDFEKINLLKHLDNLILRAARKDEIETVPFHCCFSNDQKYYMTGGRNQNIQIYRIDGENTAIVYTATMFDDGEWVSITPDGYYNASQHGDEHLNVRYGFQAFGLNQFSKAYYHPEVLEARSRGEKDPNIVRYFGGLKLSVAPPIVKVEEELKGTVANLSVTVLDPALKYPLDSVQIFINGRMLSSSELSKAKGEKIAVSDTSIISKDKASNFLKFEIEVDLEHGENLIEVLADNEACYGMKATNLTSNETKHNTKPDLWIYAIGINDYDSLPKNRPNNDGGLIDLKNAVSDSNKIIAAFKSQEGKTYNKIHVSQLSDDSALKPTKKTIKENMTFFEKMAPNDVAVFFVAAHGVSVNGSFYILPKDVFIDAEGLHPNLEDCLNVNDILQVTNIHGRKLILIDTCQSGGIDNNIVVRTLKNRSTAIFTAAREYEYAQESEDVGGHFTHSIVSCVEKNKNNDIYLIDLSNYVYNEVKQLSKFGGRGKVRQHPEILIPDGMKNYIIAK